MIPNVVRGSHFRGALDYLFDVQQGERSVKQPTLVCSNMAGSTPWELAAEFAAFERLNEKASQPSLHISLSAHPDDHLTLEQWEVIVGRFLALFGAQAKESEERPISAELNQFVAVRHSDHQHDHVHLLLNRINLDGEICYCKWDQNRAQAACRQLEHEFGLTLVAGKTEAEKTAQRILAQAARVAKAAGLPVPEACQREPRRLSRKEIARLSRQKEATGAVDPRLQAYQEKQQADQEQRQLKTAVLPPAAVAPTLIPALETPPVAVEPALEAIPSPNPLALEASQQAWGREMVRVALKGLQSTRETVCEGKHYRWALVGEALTIEAKDGRGVLVTFQRHEMTVSPQLTEADQAYFRSRQKAVKKLEVAAAKGQGGR